MMKIVNKLVVAIALLLAFSVTASAQDMDEPKTEISFEIDPATFGFQGYGFHLRVKPKNSEHLLVGVGTYAMDFPSLLVDLNPENKGQGWHVRLNRGLGLFGEYHFTEVHKKWFVGTQLAIQEYEIKKDFHDGKETFNNGLFMAYGGYTFQPFSFNMYIKTWAGLAYTAKMSGENTLGNATYDVAPILAFAAVHLGYTF